MGHHLERKGREHEYEVSQGCDLCFYDTHESDLLQYWGKQIYWTETKSCTSTDAGIQALDSRIVYWKTKDVL